MRKILLVCGLLVTSGYAFSQAAAPIKPDVKAGEAKVKAVCSSCHGMDGNGPNPQYPSLKGQKAEYLKKQISDFKSGKRTNDNGIMKAMTATLTDQDIANIAEYFSTKK